MSLLSYNELCKLVDDGVITNVDKSMVNSSSIDLTLGSKILAEDTSSFHTIFLCDRQALCVKEFNLDHIGSKYVLAPGEFILAQTLQEFNLPDNISAEYKLKSSMGRIALEHMNAGWCDAGWHGSVLTLEFANMTSKHNIILTKGDPIGQVVFFRHETVPEHASYRNRGRYNNDKEVKGTKP